jgi:hypothetical protein
MRVRGTKTGEAMKPKENHPSDTTIGDLAKWFVSHILLGASLGCLIGIILAVISSLAYGYNLKTLEMFFTDGILFGASLGLVESHLSHFDRSCPAMGVFK